MLKPTLNLDVVIIVILYIIKFIFQLKIGVSVLQSITLILMI